RDNYVGRRHVFGTAGFTNWWRAKVELDKRIAERRGAPLPPWTLHDLRRSFTTHVNELGFAQPHVTETILNHISGHKASVAGVYNRATYLPEKREALEKWGRYLTGLVGGPAISNTQNAAPAHRPLSMHQRNSPEKSVANQRSIQFRNAT